MRLVGPDTVKVYESSETWPCFFCARPTLLRVQFGRRGTLPICGGCRGF